MCNGGYITDRKLTSDGSGDAEDAGGGGGDGGRREIRLTSVLSLKKYIEDNTHIGKLTGLRSSTLNDHPGRATGLR